MPFRRLLGALLTLLAVTAALLAPTPAQAATKTPKVYSISPTTGSTLGGTKVKISGKYFTRASTVVFGDVPATSVTYSSSKKLYAYAPAAAAGKVNIRVKTPTSTSFKTSKNTSKDNFTYVAPPTITSLSKSQGKSSGGGSITVYGTSFKSVSSVMFGARKSPKVKVSSSTKMTVTVPSHPKEYELANVVVNTKYGTSTDPITYQFGAQLSELLRIGSFNVTVASYTAKPWRDRVGAVAGQIRNEQLDVVGLQEASAGNSKYTASGMVQFNDLELEVGAPYALTNNTRYCDTGAVAGDACENGASGNTRIMYNSETVELVRSGAIKLDDNSNSGGSTRFMNWATFEHLGTNKQFFVANAHMEPGESNQNLREEMAQLILDEIDEQNTDDLPVVLVGDFSSSKFSVNKAHTRFTEVGGFIDPLVNSYKYKGSPLSESSINHRFNSKNNWSSKPETVDASYTIGSYLDYILVSSSQFGLVEWETVLNLDSSGYFIKPIPSDHNLVKLTMTLP